MKDGFYTALGTPLDKSGKIIKDSFQKQIKMQITAKASGLLCMGSMGNMIGVKDSEYYTIAKESVIYNNNKIPLMIGVMDNSIARVVDRINVLSDLDIHGVVATTPYYYKVNQTQIFDFYNTIAKQSKFPLYLYDLPGVTQSPISTDSVLKLMSNKNIKGIKSGNMNLISELMRSGQLVDDFDMLYSGLDTFDIAIKGGITKNLDGMFSCTPKNATKMYYESDSSKYLKNILTLRNIFIKHGVLNSFSYAMELIGCIGIYHEDYTKQIGEQAKQEIKSYMSEIGEI